jgi:predicted dehydrogenase
MAEAPAARIRLGMVGGGRGAFIGAVHRIAARLDDRFELVAGCFGATPQASHASGADLGLPSDRVYDDFAAMAKSEARLKGGIEAVAIVTPNHLHASVAKPFLSRGIHVICDKPMTATLAEARTLTALAERSQALFLLTYTYSGYPLVRRARAMIAAGAIGTVRVVQVEYAQDWLTEAVEATGHKQAAWRTDPARSGAGGCIGDIGTHAYHLTRFVTGLRVDGLLADMQAFAPGRRLDDNAHVLLRFHGGARGMLWSSQVAPGNANGLRLRVYGDAGGLEWAQESPERLVHSPFGEPQRLITRAGPGSGPGYGPEAAHLSRTPPGHPEGYLGAFANLYAEAALAIRARQAGAPTPPEVLVPSARDGLEGVAFVDACVRSSARGGAWVRLAV